MKQSFKRRFGDELKKIIDITLDFEQALRAILLYSSSIGDFMYKNFLFAIVLFFSATQQIFADNFPQAFSEKIYLPKENILLCDQQILVGHGNRWIPVSQISADKKGLYVLRQENGSIFQWECDYCRHDNWFWDDTCWYCGRER